MDTELCLLDDIPVAGACGFRIDNLQILAVRLAEESVRVYLNRCPHLGVPLQWQEHRFLDNEGRHIQCSTHGALFDPDTGLCVQGPCRGENLLTLECHLQGRKVLLDSKRLRSLAELAC